MKFQLKPLAHALGATMALTLAACGGGGSSSGEAGAVAVVEAPAVVVPPVVVAPPPPVTLTGVVVGDQAIRNAVVCMDLNANGACDADEPASAKTGADGAYSLTYDPSKVTAAQVAAASLISPMRPGALTDAATTIDAAEPGAGNTGKPYALKQVPGKAGQINPLTTLVQAGIVAGMTDATARSNAAVQLGIDQAKIDNYQDDPAFTEAKVQDNARLMAKVTAGALEAGSMLAVADQNGAVAATATGDLRSLRYTDAANYNYSTFATLAKAAGTAGRRLLDIRTGKTAGAATAASVLYNQAYLTSAGWVRCDVTVPLSTTVGTPSRASFCNALNSVGFTASTSLADRSMSEVVTSMQADSSTNVINNGLPTSGLLAALGTARFPTGSSISARTSLNLSQPIFISSISTDARPQAEASTLEELIAAKPDAGVVLATGAGSLGLGLGTGTFKSLRVAFTGVGSATAGTVQFFECDLDGTQTTTSNCTRTNIGTYSIGTVNGARVMRFAGHAATVMNHTRLYVEVQNAASVIEGNRVFLARETKSAVDLNLSVSNRLNATAGAAMLTQLGVGP